MVTARDDEEDKGLGSDKIVSSFLPDLVKSDLGSYLAVPIYGPVEIVIT